jgi:YfiH family protein
MPDFFVPDWPAPANVRALQTTRAGGCSPAPWATFNLGDHVGDEPARVAANRAALRRLLPDDPRWLRQVHGTVAVDAGKAGEMTTADAVWTRRPGTVCAVMTADCLPVLLCDRAGTTVAAAHAGWRGLAAGVLEAAIAAINVGPGELLAWLGPAIGPANFEVGDDVRAAFLAADPAATAAFVTHGRGKWLADIYALAARRLVAAGVTAISGGGWCTFADRERFYSYRRDGVTGRMATLVWLAW